MNAAPLIGYRSMLWSLVRLRKPRRCQLCEETIDCGAMAYRPLTNGYSRMERLHSACVEKLVKDKTKS